MVPGAECWIPFFLSEGRFVAKYSEKNDMGLDLIRSKFETGQNTVPLKASNGSGD